VALWVRSRYYVDECRFLHTVNRHDNSIGTTSFVITDDGSEIRISFDYWSGSYPNDNILLPTDYGDPPLGYTKSISIPLGIKGGLDLTFTSSRINAFNNVVIFNGPIYLGSNPFPGDPKGNIFLSFKPEPPAQHTISKSITIPFWLLAVLFVLPVIATIDRNHRRRKRRLFGCCRKCGYDLRATPDRCPECGTVPQQSKLNANVQ